MWDEIYQKYYPELLRWCAAACHDTALAEDLAQETFLKALQNVDTFGDLGPSQRRAWLFRTMKNLLVDHARHTSMETQYAQRYPETEIAVEPGYEQVEEALLLGQLSGEERTLFHLRYVEGFNATELSEMLHMPPGTIRARLSRCRKILKETLSG